jgi:anaerobic ribonucleoside-triphosphate reductase activating protein
MYIARILYPVEVLGPGKRIGIWFCGCPRRCCGCSNPELWEFDDKYRISLDQVTELVWKIAADNPVDGFTITGGDPLFQYEELMGLVGAVKQISEDVLVYTGFTAAELNGKDLSGISVLIDGPYMEERNNGCLLRGSDNQNIIVLDTNFLRAYEEYLTGAENLIQNFSTPDGIISVGIHKRDFTF